MMIAYAAVEPTKPFPTMSMFIVYLPTRLDRNLITTIEDLWMSLSEAQALQPLRAGGFALLFIYLDSPQVSGS